MIINDDIGLTTGEANIPALLTMAGVMISFLIITYLLVIV